MPVWTTHEKYDEILPMWKRARDAVKGQDAVHKAGEIYLPRLKEQDDKGYGAYKKRATWFGASYQVVEGLSGMIFRKPPKLNLPAGVQKMTNDIDMAGTPLEMFYKDFTDEVLWVGRVGILVDHPPSPDTDGKPITVATKEAAGIRPTMAIYRTESIINWNHRRVKNAWALCMVVLEENHTVKDEKDEFKRSKEKRWRVLDLDPNDEYRQRIFKRKKTPTGEPMEEEEQIGKDVYPTIDGKRLNYIPFYVSDEDGVDICPSPPPLIDLVDTNFAHYRVTADYEHGCHLTGLPTPWIAGYTPEENEDGSPPKKLYIGSDYAWTFPDPQAKAGYLEFNGQGLSALEKNLDRKEVQMAIVGARMLLADNRGASNVGATTSVIHRTGEFSRLSSIARSVSTAFTRALEVFCLWAEAAGEVEFQLNRDFMPVIMDANILNALVAALTAKAIDFDTFWEMLQRGDVAAITKTAEEALAKIQAQPDFVGQPPSKKEESLAPETEAAAGGKQGVGQ